MHHNNLNPFGMSRVPLQEEVNVLCDIDYHTTTQHGTSGSGWDDTYHVRTSCGKRLAGVDDLISDCTTRPFYTYKQGQALPITIDDFLENDEDEANTALGIIGTPQSYACMEVILGGDNGIPPPASGGTSFQYRPDPSYVGWAIIRYRPVSVDGRLGNITYIFVEVWPPDVCGVEPCNILNGGTFEGLPLQSRTGAPYSSYQRIGASSNSPDLFALDPSLPPPNWVEMNGYTTSVGMCGIFGPIAPGAGAMPNERYMSLFASMPTDPNAEGLIFELCRPLLDGITYTLEYKARTGGVCQRDMRFFALQDRPCNPLQGGVNLAAADPCNGNVAPIQFLPLQSVAADPWQTQSTTFTFSGTPRNWMIAVSVGPTSGTISVDDFAIRPVITATSSITPSCNGQNDGSIDLTVNYYPGGYSVEWAHGPTTEDLTGLAPGTYTVTITDTELGCGSITEEFIVPDADCDGHFTLAKWVTPSTPPNTYAGAPVMFTIQVCNTDVVDHDVDITDELPVGFVPAFNSPSNPYWPTATITIPAGECVTTEITGYFTEIGAHTNVVTLEQDPGVSLSDDATINLLQGCPMIVYGNGGCELGNMVDLCLGMHTDLTDVESVEYYIVYPNFLDPPAPGTITGITSPFPIDGASIGTPTPLSWPSGYSAVPVLVEFSSPFPSPSPLYWFFCIDFTVGAAGVPPGENAIWTWASTTPSEAGWNRVTVNMTGGSANLWTQAYHIIFTGCPDIDPPNAGFTVDVPNCGGAVTVNADLTDPGAVHIWTWGDDRTTPTNGAQTWTYDYFEEITDNQGWPVIIPPAPPGTYTITHTVIVDGVASTSTQEITIYQCCEADTEIPDGAFASSTGTFFTGTVDIQGQFIVDVNTLFNYADVYMEPGAEIVVLNGVDLRIENSNVESCQDVMWKSITAQDGSLVRIKASRLEDAESTVAALDGSTVLLSSVQFHNNRVGLGVPDMGLPYNNVSVWMAGSTFTSAGPMPQPYPGQTTAVGNKGFAAIDARNTTLDLTAGGNVIDGMSNGIVGHYSDLDVEGFVMRNIQPDAAYDYVGNGAGIYARGDHGFYTLRQQGYGQNGTVNFDKCRWGIYTEYMNVYSKENNMLSMGTAYRVDRTGLRHVAITDNKMSTRYNGIDLRANDGALSMLVRYNIITFGNDPTCINCRGWFGIYVSEGNYANPSSRIQNNTIFFLPQYASRYGIGLFAADSWRVVENQLYMASNAFNENGIWTNGCRGHEVSCNTVVGAGTTYPNDRQAAIRNILGRAPLISCNDVDLTANGILFNGVTSNTEVRGNKLRNHKWALHLDGTAVIGTQTRKGNLWYEPAAAGGLGALHDGGAFQASLSQFWYNPATISGGDTYPPSLSPASGWFLYDPGTNYDCANDHGGEYCSQFYAERDRDKLTELDERVAADSLENDPYTEESKWMLKGDLYKKLDDHPALRDSLPVMADFYDDLQGSTTVAFKAIDDDQLALYDLDSTVVAQLQANRAQTEGLLALVKDGMAQLDDSTLTTGQQQALLASLNGYRQNIAVLSAWNATALQVATTSKALTADGVKAANAGIATTELIEANEKTVNDIYLATVGKDVDVFTTAQASGLFDIASQCPMVGGNAVFKARSLYWLIDDSHDFDDQLLCLPHGIIVKSMATAEPNALAVVPNPASDEATLVLTKQLDEPGVFVVFDAIGAEVLRYAIPMEQLRFTFSTTALAPAMYHYQVRGPVGMLGNGKLTIVR